MTLSEAFQAYASDVIAFLNQSPKTEENHFVVLKSLVSHFGDVDISTLTFRDIRDWKIELERNRSPVTVRNYIIKLRVVLAYLTRLKVPCLSPDEIPVPKKVDTVPSYLTKEQIAECIKRTCKIKNKAIVSLLYSSGIRVSELCALNRDQVSRDTFTIIGKGGKARLCFIDIRTRTLIDLYLQTRQDNNPALFLTDGGKRIRPGTVQETFKSIRKQTGFECHPHTIRHSFATNLLQTNTNLYYVSKMLGHAQLTTTQQYLHSVDFDLEKIYKKHHVI